MVHENCTGAITIVDLHSYGGQESLRIFKQGCVCTGRITLEGCDICCKKEVLNITSNSYYCVHVVYLGFISNLALSTHVGPERCL